MTKPSKVSRRTVLRGIGTVIALPWLESIMPRLSQAAEGGPPRRMAFFSVPDGMHMPDWTPKAEGARWKSCRRSSRRWSRSSRASRCSPG